MVLRGERGGWYDIGQENLIMFDAWTAVGVGGGMAALSYLAAGRKVDDASTLRLSIDKNSSLIGDVRVLGGIGCFVASMWATGDAKRALQMIAAASALSVIATEVVRGRLAKSGGRVAGELPYFPEYGANTKARNTQWARA